MFTQHIKKFGMKITKRAILISLIYYDKQFLYRISISVYYTVTDIRPVKIQQKV